MASIRTLHILNKRPGHPAFKSCLSSLENQDALLLTENGVLALVDKGLTLEGCVYALSPDLKARAIPGDASVAQAIDYDEMVALTARAQRVISW
ncbi:sulfurtransferase complex subunit TusB [Marinobacter sp. HL-58]|uniref:sulfurtransferase complex subunit TusB n=1 Tax=Marinobacter sp. HL-58 TaxID=1479237 RepID=UPI0004862C13|nr:sulfurtransferase complex subunit TusB [Marinobacter sp. HL-58]KPQ01483.1 MAG: tRNA 2-thiouridine synthesizing protein DsrH [Marinobacter sp. HL-58]